VNNPRIRCPLCNTLCWKSALDKGPYPIEARAQICKKSKGKGHGHNTFEYLDITGDEFLQNLKTYIQNRLKKLAQFLRLGLLAEHEIEQIDALVTENKNLRGEIEWLKSKNVLVQTVSHTSKLLTENTSPLLFANQKKNVTTNSRLVITSNKNLMI